MPRYINEEVLLKRLSKVIEQYKKEDAGDPLLKISDAVIDCPTADVVEVRYARWIGRNGRDYYTCSDCCTVSKSKDDEYCRGCGAKMKGGE